VWDWWGGAIQLDAGAVMPDLDSNRSSLPMTHACANYVPTDLPEGQKSSYSDDDVIIRYFLLTELQKDAYFGSR
jgi:hypothetical protein